MAGGSTLSDVADELYALAPEQFTSARDAASRRVRDDGDIDLAADVKRLRRPSLGTWLVNQLVRNRPGEIDELLELGAELRAAQQALDGAELRTMTRQRQQAIRGLSTSATELAAASGQRVGAAAQREFEGTLDAALADEQAAQAVRTGRLMRALTSTGLAAVDLSDAVAAPDAAPPARHPAQRSTDRSPKRSPQKATTRPTSKAASKAAKQADRAKQQQAERATRAAQAALKRADNDLAARQAELAAARTAVGQARDQVAELAAALAQAGARQTAAEQARRAADQAAKAAARARDAAQRALTAAENRRRH